MRADALPPYLLNPDVVVQGRFVGRPDGELPGLGLGWEVDSREHHGEPTASEATLRGDADVVAAGLALVHLVAAAVQAARQDPVHLLTAAAVARAAVPEPAGLVLRPCGPLQGGAGDRRRRRRGATGPSGFRQ